MQAVECHLPPPGPAPTSRFLGGIVAEGARWSNRMAREIVGVHRHAWRLEDTLWARSPRLPRSVRGPLGWVHPSGPALRSDRKSCDTPVIRAVPGGRTAKRGGRAAVLRTAVPSTGPLCGLCSSAAPVRLAQPTVRPPLADQPGRPVRPQDVVFLQRAAGNQAVNRLLAEAGYFVSVQRQPKQGVLAPNTHSWETEEPYRDQAAMYRTTKIEATAWAEVGPATAADLVSAGGGAAIHRWHQFPPRHSRQHRLGAGHRFADKPRSGHAYARPGSEPAQRTRRGR